MQDAAFRLAVPCRIDRGIDQTGTLEYLADDMARQARLNIQKTLSTRPEDEGYLSACSGRVRRHDYLCAHRVRQNQLNNLY